MKNNTLPILLKNPKILLIGGGKVALQKAKLKGRNCPLLFFILCLFYTCT